MLRSYAIGASTPTVQFCGDIPRGAWLCILAGAIWAHERVPWACASHCVVEHRHSLPASDTVDKVADVAQNVLAIDVQLQQASGHQPPARLPVLRQRLQPSEQYKRQE